MDTNWRTPFINKNKQSPCDENTIIRNQQQQQDNDGLLFNYGKPSYHENATMIYPSLLLFLKKKKLLL